MRLEETPSPTPSFQSMKSHQSMDWPIAFGYEVFKNVLCFPLLKLLGMYYPFLAYFLVHCLNKKFVSHPDSLRPDEAPSPATSYLSLRSNQSMDRPIAFKDRTETYGAKKYDSLHFLVLFNTVHMLKHTHLRIKHVCMNTEIPICKYYFLDQIHISLSLHVTKGFACGTFSSSIINVC